MQLRPHQSRSSASELPTCSVTHAWPGWRLGSFMGSRKSSKRAQQLMVWRWRMTSTWRGC